MGTLTLNNKTLNKYFRFLSHLDNKSKKKLIIKLTESIKVEKKESVDLNGIFGAWEDNRDADAIIKEIKGSRINNRNIEEF